MGRKQEQRSDSNSPDSSTSAKEKDPIYSEKERDSQTKSFNTELRDHADSTKFVLCKDEVDDVVKKLVDVNTTLYHWTTEQNFLHDKGNLCAQYLVNYVISMPT